MGLSSRLTALALVTLAFQLGLALVSFSPLWAHAQVSEKLVNEDVESEGAETAGRENISLDPPKTFWF